MILKEIKFPSPLFLACLPRGRRERRNHFLKTPLQFCPQGERRKWGRFFPFILGLEPLAIFISACSATSVVRFSIFGPSGFRSLGNSPESREPRVDGTQSSRTSGRCILPPVRLRA